MNQDPVYQRLREISWRRPLTESEKMELRAWLAAHPDYQDDADAELQLSAALGRLPDAPVASNFAARVMAQIAANSRVTDFQRAPATNSWWHRYLPRIAVLGVVVLVGLGIWRSKVAQQKQLVNTAREFAATELLAKPELLADFEEIASLTPPASLPDEGLLALSEDLLALQQ